MYSVVLQFRKVVSHIFNQGVNAKQIVSEESCPDSGLIDALIGGGPL